MQKRKLGKSGRQYSNSYREGLLLPVQENKITLHLSYMEFFTRDNQNEVWKVLAMKAV
jgi:hypothetical protein